MSRASQLGTSLSGVASGDLGLEAAAEEADVEAYETEPLGVASDAKLTHEKLALVL